MKMNVNVLVKIMGNVQNMLMVLVPRLIRSKKNVDIVRSFLWIQFVEMIIGLMIICVISSVMAERFTRRGIVTPLGQNKILVLI